MCTLPGPIADRSQRLWSDNRQAEPTSQFRIQYNIIYRHIYIYYIILYLKIKHGERYALFVQIDEPTRMCTLLGPIADRSLRQWSENRHAEPTFQVRIQYNIIYIYRDTTTTTTTPQRRPRLHNDEASAFIDPHRS